MEIRRILLDVTHARTQTDNVGITRTVRRLAEELPQLCGSAGVLFETVAWAAGAFRKAPPVMADGADCPGRGLLTVATGVAKPVIEQILRLPWPLVRPIWERAAGRVFTAAAAGLQEAPVGSGDVLLMVDGSWNYPVWRAARDARAKGCAVVPLVHDLMPLEAPEFCVPWVRNVFAYWLREAVLTSDAILCNSASTQQALRAYAQANDWQLPPTSPVRLGSDLAAAATIVQVRPVLREFLAGAAPVYATVGSLEPKKNHRLLLAAFEQLWEQGESCGLLVLGRRTPECADVAARLAALAAIGRPVLALHDATDSEVAHAYSHCRAMVLPSLFEGFGLPLVEARSRGCVVLASDIPAFRELADAGVRMMDHRTAGGIAEAVRADAAGERLRAVGPMQPWLWRDCAAQCLGLLQGLLSRDTRQARGADPIEVSRSHSIAPP